MYQEKLIDTRVKTVQIPTQINNFNPLITELQQLIQRFLNTEQRINNSSQLTQSQRQKLINKIKNPLQQLLIDCQKKQEELKSLLNSQGENKPTNYLPYILGFGILVMIGLIVYLLGRKKNRKIIT